MEKPDIYLDIDGVLRGGYSPVEDVVDFVRYILDNFPGQIYWLTTHCGGGVNNTLPALRDAFPEELAEEMFAKVKPTDWRELKTDGIDFGRDFVWFDDNLFASEGYMLDVRDRRYNVYVFNPRERDEARRALEFIKNCPMGGAAPLRRFTSAVVKDFELVKAELAGGAKYGHYMWYMFPQIRGLGSSEQAEYYAIRDEIEAVEFLNDEYLAARLVELCEVLLGLPGNDPLVIFGEIDTLKLRSSMTLFARSYENNGVEIKNTTLDFGVFRKVLDKFYGGREDELTLEILGYTF